MCYSYTMKYYQTIKRSEVIICATKWIKLYHAKWKNTVKIDHILYDSIY